MKAACWHGKRTVRVDDVPEPRILNARDAIVRVTSTSICGSDIQLYDGLVPSLAKGDVLGHEFMGVVVEVGEAVKNLAVGDRVVVPFPIACGRCRACEDGLFSLCENSNPNAWMAERLWGHSPGGIFGCSRLFGGFAGGQAEYVRVPFADVGPLKVPEGLSDERVLLLSDVFPTGYAAADLCNIRSGHVVAVWGAGPVGQLAIASAKLLGAERIISIDRLAYRLELARLRAGATDVVNCDEVDVYEALQELTGGRGPDAAIDAVGLRAENDGKVRVHGLTKRAARRAVDRPSPLRQAIRCVRNGGVVSVVGLHGGFIDEFPIGAVVNRALTLRSGRCHVQRYMRPLLERIQREEIDPSFVITHRMPLARAADAYELFVDRKNGCEKVVLQPA